jgi:uncharacterized protein
METLKLMDVIYIPRLLKAPERTEDLRLEDFISGLDTLTPIRGLMKIRHGGNFLDIAVTAETIVTLTCDRCLQQYNQRLTLDTSELIWLDKMVDMPETLPQEREIAWDDLSETLSPDGYFDPETWLYEQLSLALPLRQLCSNECQQPIEVVSSETPVVDNRWAALASLKQQLSQ